jgi:hypothetical protein
VTIGAGSAIRYKLDDAHPDYQRLIPELLSPLAEKYPQAKLKEVRLFEAKPGNRSLGNADAKGVIEFNPFWFRQPAAVLQAEAIDRPRLNIGGYMLAWHGLAVEEPAQVCVHEFGHILAQQIPECLRWSKDAWAKATRDPRLSPSAYGLVNDSEFFAECFCMYELGVAPDWMAREVAAVIGRA